MKGNIPLFLRLTLVVILAVSFSLVPMAVEPKMASAASVADLVKDIFVEVGTSPNQAATPAVAPATQGTVQRVVAGPTRAAPTITVNVGDTVTVKAARANPIIVNDVNLSANTHTHDSGMRHTMFVDAAGVAQTYPTVPIAVGLGDFSPGASISLTLAGAPLTTVPANPTVGTGVAGDAGAGKFFPISFKVPAMSRKTSSSPAILKYSDGTTDITVNVVVNQKLQFTPDKAAKGRTITVTGTGFRANSSIDVEVRTPFLIANGTGVGTGLPMNLTFPFGGTDGVSVTTVGTFTITVPALMTGVASNGTNSTASGGPATVTGSPVALVAGANVITTTTTGMMNVFLGPATTLASSATLPSGVASGITIAPGGTVVGLNSNATSAINVTTLGNFVITTPAGVTGTVTSGTSTTSANATVTGSPVAIAAGGATTINTTTIGGMVVTMTAATPPGNALRVSQGTITSDATGSFSGTFAAPEIMDGASPANSINARDGGDAKVNGTELTKDVRIFTMDPSMTISPTSVGAGGTITIDGTEFVPGAGFVSLTIGGTIITADSLGSNLAGKLVDVNGKVPAFQVNVPRGLTGGAKSVAMTFGATSSSASVTVTTAALSMTPATGPKNQEVVIGIREMPAATAVAAITFGGTAAVLPAAGVTTDSNGNATVTVRVPNLATTGSTDVVVTMVGGASATGTYTTLKPTIALSPTEQSRTGIVTVTGKGWVADKNVTITVAGGVSTVNATPDAAGNFTVAFTVSTDLTPDSNSNVVATDIIGGVQGNAADNVVLRVPASSVKVSPTAVGWSQTLTLTGSGFTGGSQMRYGLPWTGVAAATSFATAVYTDAAGNFTASLVVPTVTKGVRSIGVTDGVNSATTTVEISEAPATVASALAPIAAQLVRVWGFDAPSQSWKLYDPSVPAELNTLATLAKGSGYFINVKAATTITTGSGNTVSLSPGWQILGW